MANNCFHWKIYNNSKTKALIDPCLFELFLMFGHIPIVFDT